MRPGLGLMTISRVARNSASSTEWVMKNTILFEGGYPVYAQLCKEKEMPYPQLGPAGEILADERWWQQMQLTRKGWAAQQEETMEMEYPDDEN